MILQTLTDSANVSPALFVRGGLMGIYAAGTWGGGTLTLLWSPTTAGTYVPLGTGISATADGTTAFLFTQGYVQATLSGSSGATIHWGIAEAKYD